MNYSVRPLEESDIPLVVDYFHSASPDFLKKMGVEPQKIPSRADFSRLILEQLALPIAEKSFFYVIWLYDDVPIGHNNINLIEFGNRANMHLHIWNPDTRQRGAGATLLTLSIPIFFNLFELKTLFCEPNAHNEPPNRTLPKLGFEFLKMEEKIPGFLNFFQPLNVYQLTRSAFEKRWNL